MQKPVKAFSSYLRESRIATVAAVLALLGGGTATALKALGWERPMPVWLAWLICLAVVVVSQYWIYARLHERHEALLTEIRSAARMTPAIRDRIQLIKEISGRISSGIQRMSDVDRATIETLTDQLFELGGQVGEHHTVTSNVFMYVAWVNEFFRAVDEAEDAQSRRKVFDQSLLEDHKMYSFLVQSCNRVLERYPLPAPASTPPAGR